MERSKRTKPPAFFSFSIFLHLAVHRSQPISSRESSMSMHGSRSMIVDSCCFTSRLKEPWRTLPKFITATMVVKILAL